MGKISVVIPAYNRGNHIGKSIDSILEQSFTDWECIVVDDHSTDDTMQKAFSYAQTDSRIKIFKNQNRKGAQGARNTGAAKANGAYILFLDSDDVLSKNCLLNRLEFADQNPGYNYYCFPTALFKEAPLDTDLLWNYLNKPENDLIRFLKTDMPWHTCGVLWRKETFDFLKGWDENLSCWQDWDLHIRALIDTNLKYLKSPNENIDSFYRIEGDYTPISSQEHSLKSIKSKMYLMDKFATRLPLEQQGVQIEFARLIYRISIQVLMVKGLKVATEFFTRSITVLDFSRFYILSWSFYFICKNNRRFPRPFLKMLGLVPRIFYRTSLLENQRTHLTAKIGIELQD